MHMAAQMIKRMVAVLTVVMVTGAAAAAGAENATAGEGAEAGAPEQLPSADLVPGRSAPGPPATSEPSLQSGGGLPACRAWTDGCVICQRAEGPAICSNIGIACQPL